MLGLVGYSFVVLHENEKKPAREIQIGVTGQQFVWTFQYPRAVTGGAALDSYALYLPDNESVYFNIHSKDVIHSFWIPAFRLQEDAVPGITTHYRATPDRLGTYPVDLRSALRPGTLADARARARRHPGALSRMGQEPAERVLARKQHRRGGERIVFGRPMSDPTLRS